MELSAACMREVLDAVAVKGWDSPEGRDLLGVVRRRIVVPQVRRAGLSGAAAAQAEASAWEVAWETLARPSTRAGENPGAMVRQAVRQSVWAEVFGAPARPVAGRAGGCSAEGRPASLDRALEAGLQLASRPCRDEAGLGPRLEALVRVMERHGWNRQDAADALALLADHAALDRRGQVSTRWRLASLRLGIPEWRVRRLATVLLGSRARAGLMARMVAVGPEVLREPWVDAAIRWTVARSAPPPWASAPAAPGSITSRIPPPMWLTSSTDRAS